MMSRFRSARSAFFCTDTAPPEIYTLSLHDALPIFLRRDRGVVPAMIEDQLAAALQERADVRIVAVERSEEHTSELQSRENLVCRLLLEKKKPCERPYGAAHRPLRHPPGIHRTIRRP